MRASSLSNPRVIELLNRLYVPVHVRNQEALSPRAAQEKARIYRTALERGLKAGAVCVYLLSPDGRPLATAPLNERVATDPEQLAALMERAAREADAAPGEPLVRPNPAPEVRDPETLALRIVSRYLRRHAGALIPNDARGVLGTRRAGNWGDLPSEVRIELRREEWSKLLPTGRVKEESEWEPEAAIVARILDHFYPPTENTDLRKNRIDRQTLRARVESVREGLVEARLEGRFRMKHPFYHRDDDNFVEAELLGRLHIAGGRILLLEIVTDGGRYGGSVNGVQPFGAAARVATSG